MVGLGNVDNTSDANKPVSTAIQTALDSKADKLTTYTKTDVDTKISNLIGAAPEVLNTLNELAAALSNDANYATTVQTQLASKAPLANPYFTGTVSGITKSMVGLGNVDNTTDANKPISSATQTALDAKANLSDLSNKQASITTTTDLHLRSITASGTITANQFISRYS